MECGEEPRPCRDASCIIVGSRWRAFGGGGSQQSCFHTRFHPICKEIESGSGHSDEPSHQWIMIEKSEAVRDSHFVAVRRVALAELQVKGKNWLQ